MLLFWRCISNSLMIAIHFYLFSYMEEIFFIRIVNLIKYSSVASWEHINMLGEYDYSDERVNTITQFHLPKILELQVV